MMTASTHAVAGHWPATDTTAEIPLDFDARHRRRIRLHASNGEHLLLDLPKAVAMAEGDGLQAEDGRWFWISAKPEPLLEVTASDRLALMRLTWHLGNRHTPAEVQADRILIRHDHVLAAMVEGLGGEARSVEEPFQPEGGAYGDHGHARAHTHDDGHHHGHSHD